MLAWRAQPGQGRRSDGQAEPTLRLDIAWPPRRLRDPDGQLSCLGTRADPARFVKQRRKRLEGPTSSTSTSYSDDFQHSTVDSVAKVAYGNRAHLRLPDLNSSHAEEDDVNQAYDAVVVGAGALGTATAYHLTREGKRVALLDRGAR